VGGFVEVFCGVFGGGGFWFFLNKVQLPKNICAYPLGSLKAYMQNALRIHMHTLEALLASSFIW